MRKIVAVLILFCLRPHLAEAQNGGGLDTQDTTTLYSDSYWSVTDLNQTKYPGGDRIIDAQQQGVMFQNNQRKPYPVALDISCEDGDDLQFSLSWGYFLDPDAPDSREDWPVTLLTPDNAPVITQWKMSNDETDYQGSIQDMVSLLEQFDDVEFVTSQKGSAPMVAKFNTTHLNTAVAPIFSYCGVQQ